MTGMAGDITELRAAVRTLQAAYDTAVAELAVTFEEPSTVRDASGRYLLLDALTALVNARTALIAIPEEKC